MSQQGSRFIVSSAQENGSFSLKPAVQALNQFPHITIIEAAREISEIKMLPRGLLNPFRLYLSRFAQRCWDKVMQGISRPLVREL